MISVFRIINKQQHLVISQNFSLHRLQQLTTAGLSPKLLTTRFELREEYRHRQEISYINCHTIHNMGGRNRLNMAAGFGNGNRFHGNMNDNRDYGSNNNRYSDFNERTNNDMMNNLNLIQLVSNMASNFNMTPPPPPPPTRMSCGELRACHSGMLVELTGRLIKKRVSRFAELRDRSGGATQLVISEEKYPRMARRIFNMPENSTLTIIGTVTMRPPQSYNQTMPTGEIEVEVEDILNIGFPVNSTRSALKRNFSTAAQENSCGITSTEYKMAKSDSILKYFENRDLTCNDLRRTDIGRTVTLVGWIPATKNSKFMQLKDGYGQTQIIVEDKTLQDTCLSAPEHTILQVTGKVLGRPKPNINLKYDTGEIEVLVESAKVLSPDEPYEGPVKAKHKLQKLSIDQETSSGHSDGILSSDNVQLATTQADTNKFANRTHNCGELSIDNVGEKVVVCGWLEFQRLAKFFVLRDGYGQIQVLLTDKLDTLNSIKEGLPLESIIRVEGIVRPRPTSTINPQMQTGHVEVEAEKVDVLNYSKKNLPFEIRKFNRAGERLRLTYRYLDLRFADMQKNLRTRSAVIHRMRDYLISYLGFVEVETPTLFRRTPGGAQEFVVPTRKPGHFYSLVQSPQQFKQMLMAGAIDRYFQVARCYRDEATRPDRQPEFTQLDIELSFTTREGIMQLVEEVLRYAWPKELPQIQAPFPRMTYSEAMEQYGTDKPDTRFGYMLKNMTEIVSKNESIAGRFKDMGAYAIVVPDNEAFYGTTSRKHYEDMSKQFNGVLFARKFTTNEDVQERLSKLLGTELAREFNEQLNVVKGDLLFLAISEKSVAQTMMGQIRLDYYDMLVQQKKVKPIDENKFLWVIDFPMFAFNETMDGLDSVHHPFTAPHIDDMEKFKSATFSDFPSIRSQAYDLVLNGQEIGGGSMRIHDRHIQEYVLEQVLKIPKDHLSHLLNALESGCPPHGGIALGLDRLIAIICQTHSIRDVIAFPKSLNGRDPLSNAPVPISDQEKAMYHLAILNENSKENENEAGEEVDDGKGERSSEESVQKDELQSQ